MKIGLSRIHFPVTTLGPGQRLGIWFQGCSIRCPGCISADTWKAADAPVDVSELLDGVDAWLSQCDGITISGGEPFDQPQALMALLRQVRARRPDVDVLAYSGHAYERLAGLLADASGLIDALITDPFELAEAQTMLLRGSDNQRLHLLTDLGRDRFAHADRHTKAQDRQLDLMLDDDGVVWLAGIPSRGDMRRLQGLLQAQGHSSLTSEAPTTVCKTPR